MNPISFIKHHLVTRREASSQDPVKKLAEKFDDYAVLTHFSKGQEKRLVRLFNEAQAHVCQHRDFDDRRSELLKELNHVRDQIVPNMRECTTSRKIESLSASMLQQVRNLQPQASIQNSFSANVWSLSDARFRSPDICSPDSSIRVIDVKTMSLREAFALKLNNASVSVETMNKLDAIFMREYRILLNPLESNGYPKLHSYMFGNASLPGFKSLSEATVELNEIDSMVSLMKDSHAATALDEKVSVYKAHIEAAALWWTEAAHRAARLTDPDANKNKPLMDRARFASVWLGDTPAAVAQEFAAAHTPTMVQTPPPQTKTVRFSSTTNSPTVPPTQGMKNNRPDIYPDELQAMNRMIFHANNPQYDRHG